MSTSISTCDWFQAIAAMSQNRVIGANNRIPWHLPEDLRWFKRMTRGHVIVMGRKTFESIGKPLPHRETIVISSSLQPRANLRVSPTLSAIHPAHECGKVFLCGGAKIYEQGLPLCSDLFLTLVKRSVPGDTFFPPFEHLFDLLETIEETEQYTIRHYRRTAEHRALDQHRAQSTEHRAQSTEHRGLRAEG